MERQPHLHLIDQKTGEVLEECPNCDELKIQLTGIEADLRKKRAEVVALKRDRERKAHEHNLWPEAIALFNYWREKCRHPKSKFGADRFEMLLPLLRDYGPMMCRRAIDGAAFDPNTKRRRNGSVKRYDDWELVFRDRGHLEEFVNRAPRKPDA